jgi:hypothetical protein
MLLSLFSITKAKPKEKRYKLSDGHGLYLRVKPRGGKSWRFRYHFAGKQNMLSFGSFLETSLASARAKRDEARRLVAEGIDPAQRKKFDKLAAKAAANNTFGAVAAEYLEKLREEGKAQSTIEKNQWLLEELALPLARRPIADITAAEILDLLKRIEKTGRRHTATTAIVRALRTGERC